MRIMIIGAGYVGLVSAVGFAEFGWTVECVDNNTQRVDMLKRCQSPIFEPGLDELLEKHTTNGRLTFSGSISESDESADVIFLAVGTPMSHEGEADLTYVFQAVEDIASQIEKYTIIVTKSTVPVGTNKRIEDMLREKCPGVDVDVCSNPEFLREGSAIKDFLEPDRVLLGINAERAESALRTLYAPLQRRGVPIIVASRESAEVAKYSANAFLALKITFINQIADLCEQVGADVIQVAHAIGVDHRIGDKFLAPGPGYGGSCFPKDVAALARTARLANSPVTLVEEVARINTTRKTMMVEKIEDAVGGVKGRTIGLLGVTFKANTDDMRDSPSLVIVPELIRRGAEVRAFDPQGMENAREMIDDVVWCETALDAVTGTEAIVLLTEWDEFAAIELEALREKSAGSVLVDLRNLYNPDAAAAAGFQYTGIGRT